MTQPTKETEMDALMHQHKQQPHQKSVLTGATQPSKKSRRKKNQAGLENYSTMNSMVPGHFLNPPAATRELPVEGGK